MNGLSGSLGNNSVIHHLQEVKTDMTATTTNYRPYENDKLDLIILKQGPNIVLSLNC